MAIQGGRPVPRAARVAVATTLVGALAMWLGPSYADAFEGTITIEDNSEDEMAIQRYSFKGERLRVEDVSPNADGGAVIFDGKMRTGFVIDTDEQVYIPFAWDTKTPDELKQDSADLVVTKTGKHDKVAGRTCDVYLQRDKVDGSTVEFCLGKGLANAALVGLVNGDAVPTSPLPAWLVERTGEGLFPLRGIERTRTGKEVSRFEATKIESKRLDDRLFSPPVGFTRLNVDQAGRSPSTR
ncbi:hypothetical protein YTPLAS18_00390 [Nitrospira sp.]|nr:hypothetical protein YTPLAS18_00390 [Nitrospira sp.]